MTEEQEPTTSGARFREVAAANVISNPLELTEAEIKYYECMRTFQEIACVGAGIGEGFENTTELQCDEVGCSPRIPRGGKQAVDEEHNNRMVG
jgi:hypothetical protein